MGRARKHHYVPQALQRYFRSAEGKIWYSERVDQGRFGKPEKRNTRSTFKARDYYTVLDDDGLSDRIERNFHGEMDDFLGQFLAEVHRALDDGSAPVVEGESLSSIRRVVIHLIARTPEFTSDFDEFGVGEEVLSNALADAIEANLDATEIEKIRSELEDRIRVRNFGRSIRTQAQAGPFSRIDEALKDFDVRFAQSKGQHSFILSSLSAYRIGNGGHNGLSNPRTEIWLPISPKRALVLLKDPQKKIPMVVTEPRDHIRKVNEFAVSNSNEVASHSEKLLLSLLG